MFGDASNILVKAEGVTMRKTVYRENRDTKETGTQTDRVKNTDRE